MPAHVTTTHNGKPLFRYRRHIRLIGFSLSVGLLSACAHQPTMYSWDSYQPAVYAYLQGDNDPAAQTLAMEKNIETARARNTALPPGFHAHLGLLYLQQGQDARAVEQIQSEKTAFPESAAFMDFLLRQTNKSNASSTSTTEPGSAKTKPAAVTDSSDKTSTDQPS